LPLPITMYRRSLLHEKTAKAHLFNKRSRAKVQRCRSCQTLYDRQSNWRGVLLRFMSG